MELAFGTVNVSGCNGLILDRLFGLGAKNTAAGLCSTAALLNILLGEWTAILSIVQQQQRLVDLLEIVIVRKLFASHDAP